MVGELLTDRMQADGRTLTKALDEAGLRVTAALWFYFPDAQQWRYVFATPSVDTDGPLKVYTRVHKIIARLKKQLPSVDLTAVTAVSSKDPIARLLAHFGTGTRPGTEDVRFTRSSVNGQFIEDAFVYRMPKAA